MSTRYYDLLDVRVEVDSSGLKEKLDELEASTWTEDTINDLIEQKLSNDGYITGDDIDTSLTDKIEDYDYVTGDEVDAKIESALENGNYASDSTVEDMGERLEALEAQLRELRETHTQAMTFFDLIKQAFSLLQARG